jgi:hypothetical protein
MRQLSPRLIIASFAIALTVAPALAFAQSGPPHRGPGYGHYQDSEGFFLRRGLTAGLGFGVGGLSTDSGIFDCTDCASRPAAFGFHGHLGIMLDHRLALSAEYWNQIQRLDYFGDAYGWQHMVMGSLQHWLHPQVWIKGGLGIATLQVTYFDGFAEELNYGTALMAAAGYEFAFAPDFAIDVQLRLGTGMYRYVADRANTALIGIGIAWF